VLQVIKDIGRFEICKYHEHVRIRRDLSHMVCQCNGTWKGIKSKAGGSWTSHSKHCSHTCVSYVLVIAQSLL